MDGHKIEKGQFTFQYQRKVTLESAPTIEPSLLFHTPGKIMLKIIQKRLEPYMEQELSATQAGFRKSRGTRDQIAKERWIMETARENQKKSCSCFVDYSKAFDCVDHDLLWNVLLQMGIPANIVT